MMTRDQSCEERIHDHMVDRLDTMRAVIAAADDDESYGTENQTDDGESVDSLRESLLSFEVRYQVRLTLSTGGPADGFDLVVDGDGEIRSGTYWFQDWFDGATRPLDRDELDMVEQIYGPFDSLVADD